MNELQFALMLGKENPGALQGALEMLKPENLIFSISIITRLEKCPTIVGTNFYILYSDLCNKDFQKMSLLCSSNISNELLEEACSKQDYSGRKIIEPYLK